MTCDWVQAVIERFDPDQELSDAVVAHLDACEECRHALDRRFPPAFAPAETPRRVAEPRAKRAWGPSVAIVAAAAAVLLIQLNPRPTAPDDDRLALYDASQVCEVEWEPPQECELF